MGLTGNQASVDVDTGDDRFLGSIQEKNYAYKPSFQYILHICIYSGLHVDAL